MFFNQFQVELTTKMEAFNKTIKRVIMFEGVLWLSMTAKLASAGFMQNKVPVTKN